MRLFKRVCKGCCVHFETDKTNRQYCTPSCQIKHSSEDHWLRVKTDYKRRLRVLKQLAKNRAATKAVSFNLTTDYLIDLWDKQQGLCAVSGREFDLSRPVGESVRANAPSLDRINPSLGYTQGNIRIVCYQVNTALNEYGLDGFLKLCKDVIAFNKSR